MKTIYTFLLALFLFCIGGQDIFAQFIVAQDTIRGQIEFRSNLKDSNSTTMVPNDSVFYMFAPDMSIDPWRRVCFYTSSRTNKNGYIQGSKFMRVDDYDLVEVERLSSHGTISFKSEAVRVVITVANITTKDTHIKRNFNGDYTVNNKSAKGFTGGSFPKLKYQSISVSINGKNIVLPKRLYEFLLDPDIENTAVYYNAEKKIVYINANNGGTTSSYSVLWSVTPKGASNAYIFDPLTNK